MERGRFSESDLSEEYRSSFGSSLFLMDKMLFQFTRIGFCDDIHTKQRRAAVFNEFLIEQRQLLDIEKQEDYRDYEEVIDLFVQFLNNYAYLNLGIEDAEFFDNLYNNADKEYCDIFGSEYIGDSEVEEFLSNYMLREVLTDVDFLKASVKVISELVNWLHANGYMDDGDYNETVKILSELKSDVLKAKELAILFLEYIESHPVNKL